MSQDSPDYKQLFLESERARKEAEERAERHEEKIRKTNLPEFLHACHVHLQAGLAVQTDNSQSTKGNPANANEKTRPNRISLWEDFPTQQEAIWDTIADSEFMSERHFTSLQTIEETGMSIRHRMMSSELDLNHFERSTVEDQVSLIITHLYRNQELRDIFNIKGLVKFENHSNTLSPDSPEEVEMRLQQLELSGSTFRRSARLMAQTAKSNSQQPSGLVEPPAVATSSKSWPPPRADQFCVYNIGGDASSRVAAFIIEYKPPHKLTLGYIYEGLADMDLNDVIYCRDGESSKDIFRRLVAAVITQIFSYMISGGLEYGYVCTGEAFIFLKVPEDPSTVYYYLSVPKGDVGDDTGWEPDSSGSNRLHLTAVGQVLAFTLQALRTRPRSQAWKSAARAQLSTWEVVYEDVFDGIVKAVPTHETPSSEYRPRVGAFSHTSPVRIGGRPRRNAARRCRPPSVENQPNEDSFDPDTPTQPRRLPSQRPSQALNTTNSSTSRQHTGARNGNGEYCTQDCLRGLVGGGPLDFKCPNVKAHGTDSHQIDRLSFLTLMRLQLARDLDTNFEPIAFSFTRGIPFKVKLASFGYTLVAKGTTVDLIHHLKHEASVYERLEPIQGIHVPVYVGNVDLDQPYYHEGYATIVHLMFISFGGTPIHKHLNADNRTTITHQVKSAIHAIHQLKVLHQDAMPRNILWNSMSGQPMIIDFERAKIQELHVALGATSSNRKRKLEDAGDVSKLYKTSLNEFKREMNRAVFELRELR